MIKRRGALAVFLSFAFLLAAVVIPSGTAIANGPQFSMSATSLRAGQAVVVSEVDPCPEPDPNSWGQYVYVLFTDSNDSSVLYSQVTSTLGHWDSIRLATPARRAYSMEPPEAALGAGSIEAWCAEAWETGNVTTRVYDAQTLTITDDSAEFSLTPAEPQVGQTVVIESIDPCPSGTESVDGYLDDMNMTMLPYEATPDTTGQWEAELTIPSEFAIGDVRITAVCRPPAPHWGTRTQTYGEMATSVFPATPYVALGDSYSSGTGTFNYYQESGDCLRSGYSYPLYVADQLSLGVPLFAACHGAQTADFHNQNPNTGEPAQISHLSTDTEVVTLTIGGNDAGFKGVLERCVNSPDNSGWGCSTDTAFTADLADRFDALAGGSPALAADGRPIYSLENLYKDIATAAPNAKIYVGGYPRLFGSDIANYTTNSNAPGGAQCAIPIGATVSYDDAQWLNQKANELNGITFDAVQAAQNDGVDITFVSAALFTGHGQCDSQGEWIHPVVFGSSFNDPLPESLHPTSGGYTNGYGIAFVAAMN